VRFFNFIKIHSTLRCSPAIAAGVTDRLGEASDLVALLEASNGRYKSGAALGSVPWASVFLLAIPQAGSM
jgi:hypothetical protein